MLIEKSIRTAIFACVSKSHSRTARRIVVCALPLLIASGLCQSGSAQQKTQASGTIDLRPTEQLVQQGQLEDARAQVNNVLKQHPSSADAYDLLGIIEAQEQHLAEASAALQKAVQLAPNSTKAHNNLGNLYLAEKKLDLAETEFRTVLRFDPANSAANAGLGLLLIGKGSPDEAIAHLERARPQSVEVRLALVRALLESHRPAEAVRIVSQLSTEKPNDAQVHLALGVMLASEAQYKPAEIELEKADLLEPGTFEIAYDLGQTYLRAKEYQKADLELSRATKLKPESTDALYLLAQVYNNESRPLDALDLLVRANRMAPENTDVILAMAQIVIAQRYFEDAIPLLEKGVQIAPKRTDLRLALGESYFKADKVDKAIEQFNQVIATEPSARAYSFLGLSHIYLGRFDEAKKDFQNGLKLEPKNNFCLFQLGYIAERQGKSVEAETTFKQVLRADPEFPDALLELANLYIEQKKFPEAGELLRRFVRVAPHPASGYYKLAMTERNLHQTDAANKDLTQFQLLSKNESPAPYEYEHLFDYVDSRSKLSGQARVQSDLAELIDQSKKHPDQSEVFYMLAAAYLKAGETNEANRTIEQLDQLSAGDAKTLTGTGVLLARYRHYDDAIRHFQSALEIAPGKDEIEFDLADAYFRKGSYSDALAASEKVSSAGRTDDAYLSLLGDIYAHLGESSRAEDIFQDAVTRNPDNDQDYLSLALLDLREGKLDEAKHVLANGQARIPASGKILWGMGLVDALQGKTQQATGQLEKAVDMLPEWPGSYSTLGVFYFETGQIDKAREVLDRFRNSSASGSGLDVNRIEQVLAQAPQVTPIGDAPLPMADRTRLLQFALALADRTL